MIELLPNSIEIKLKTKFSLTNNENSDKSLDQQPQKQQNQQQQQTNEVSQASIQIDVLNANLDSLNTNSALEIQKKIAEKWNKITTCIIDNKKVIVNRVSWINKNGKSIRYTIDSMGYPL